MDYSLEDEIKFLSRYFDVARYTHSVSARNHMALLLNMDLQKTYLTKTRYLLKIVMKDSNLNCLFYKIYSESLTMEKVSARIVKNISYWFYLKLYQRDFKIS